MLERPRFSELTRSEWVTDLLDTVQRNLVRIEELRSKLLELQVDMEAVREAELREHPAAEPLKRRPGAAKPRKRRAG